MALYKFLHFRAGLSLGSSKHWSFALKEMTGEEKLDASALLEYFQPLHDYLRELRKLDEDALKEVLQTYDTESQKLWTDQVEAEWKFATDVNNPTAPDEQVK